MSVCLTSDSDSSFSTTALQEAGGGGARRIGDVWRWLGMSGDFPGTSGASKRTFLYSLGVVAAIVGVVNAENVLTVIHARPQIGIAAPIVWEGSSLITLLLFFWIPWIAWRAAPPFVRPRWTLLIHAPMALAFSVAHVGGFILLRKLTYRLAGAHYDFGAPISGFLYELRKDLLGYALFIAGFTLIDHMLRQQRLIDTPKQSLTFDIRDGARLHRVRLEEVLGIASAGNYVEFLLRDGRKLLMRSSLSALETELAPRGFLRTHRSWLVNATHMTALRPEGSGDYTIRLGAIEVPLSRRFPAALAKLRGE